MYNQSHTVNKITEIKTLEWGWIQNKPEGMKFAQTWLKHESFFGMITILALKKKYKMILFVPMDTIKKCQIWELLSFLKEIQLENIFKVRILISVGLSLKVERKFVCCPKFNNEFYINIARDLHIRFTLTKFWTISQFRTLENSLIEIGGIVNSKLKLKTNCEVSETIKNGIKKSNFLRGKMFPK